jgi:Tfp pilus assembly protein PilO
MLRLKASKQLSSIRKHLPWMTATAILALAYPWFINPIFQSAQASGRSGYTRSLYQERLDQLEQIAVRQTQQCKNLQDWKREHENLLFSPAQAEAFFSSLDQKAVSLGCQVVSAEYEILPLPGDLHADPSAPIEMKGVKVLLTGRYDRLIQFLNWIESLPECVLISTFKMETAKDRTGVLSGRIDFAIPITSGAQRPAQGPIAGDKE